MEAVAKRTGNPNFGKKKTTSVESDAWGIEPDKSYTFQLTQTHEKNKPRDKETGEMVGMPYPELFWLPNAGVALDRVTGQQRRWRYVYGYSSIWEDEQTPTPSKQQIEDQRNFIEFKKGLLIIKGTNAPKIMALLVQDTYEGNENPIQQLPKTFKMVDATAELQSEGENIDLEFEALYFAQKSTLEEMLPVAMALGIDISNADDEEERELIRINFKKKAKENPKAFLKQVKNPRNEIKRIMTVALQRGIISSSAKEGYLTVVESGVNLFPINSAGDVPEELVHLVMSNDDKANKLYEQLKRQL